MDTASESERFLALHQVAVFRAKDLLAAGNRLFLKSLAATQFTQNTRTFEFLLELLEGLVD